MNIETILKDSYDYIVAPKAMLNTPVELKKMAKYEDPNDPTLITGYYTINELDALLGKLFVPTDAIDDRFVKFRWAFDRNREEQVTIDYLKTMGLVNMREQLGELDKQVEEIDFTTLNGNEFGIFSLLEIRRVPAPPVEDIMP